MLDGTAVRDTAKTMDRDARKYVTTGTNYNIQSQETD
jgi:hypothetical protein